MISKDLLIQLISKSKEFCYTFYMLLDRLQPALNPSAPNGDTTKAIAGLLQAFGCKMDSSNTTDPVSNAKTVNAPQIDDETSISQSDNQEPIIPPKEEKKTENNKAQEVPNESKKPGRYNGYLLFYKSIVGELKVIYPTYGFADMAKVVSAKWKELTTEERHKWNVKSNPVKYNKVAKKKAEKVERQVHKKRKQHDNKAVESKIIPTRNVEEIQISNEVSMRDVLAEKKPGSNESTLVKLNIDYDAVTNQRAELKKKLLHENQDQAAILKKTIPQIMVPGGSNSSLF